MTIKIYEARRILTMNPSNPEASYVAVKGDRILGVGTIDELSGWGDFEHDTRFADKILDAGPCRGAQPCP